MASPQCRISCVLISQQASANVSLRAFAEACFRFTPQVALGDNAVFLEVGKSRLLFSEAGLRARIERLAHRFEFRVRLGWGSTAGEALARARHGEGPLPLYALREFASPFARLDPEKEKRVAELTKKLSLLGLKTFDEFKRFPAAGLASRFGDVATLLEEVWPEFKPEPLITESVEIEEDVSVLSLVEVLKRLADRALARLWGKCERASVVEVKFGLAKWSTLASHERRWRIELPLPQGSVAGLAPIIQEHLMADLTKIAFGAPVTKVSLTILEGVPGNGAQRDFFSKTEQEKEAWNALVGRLSYKLGSDRVFVALPVERYLPEKAYQRITERSPKMMKALLLEEEFESTDRPARLLRNPEPIEKEGDLLVHPRTGREWHTLKWDGPERLSGEWWVGLETRKFSGFQRDYFRVIAKGGEELWVFYNRNKSGWFLHGFFD